MTARMSVTLYVPPNSVNTVCNRNVNDAVATQPCKILL